MNIVVIIRVDVARAVSIKLDFNLIPNLKLIDDQNGVRRRFTQTTPTTTNSKMEILSLRQNLNSPQIHKCLDAGIAKIYKMPNHSPRP